MNVSISVVQPKAFGENEEKNVEEALRYIDEAASEGAKIICFPEGYPGPFWERFYFSKEPKSYDWTQTLCSKAREKEVYVIAGKLEYIDEKNYYDILLLIDDDGKIAGKYKRTTPLGPYLFDEGYQVGDDLPVFKTPYGVLGLLTCSEVYAPELSRVLALKGAEIIFLPSGGLIAELTPTWKALVWARAIENLAYTATCQDVFGVEDGIAMIAGPEEILGEKKDAGVLTATLDLDRVRWLREQEEKIEFPKKYKVVPGTLKWRRPRLYRNSYADW